LTVKTDLLALMRRAEGVAAPPPVRRVYIPEPRPHVNAHTEFGLVELEDGSAGLYYAWLGESQQGMTRQFSERDLAGRPALTLTELLKADDDASRSLGMAAVNAISQYVFKRAGFTLETAADSMGSLALAGGDHLGMVGYFPSLVERLRDSGIRVTVIEKKSRFAGRDGNVTVSLDVEDLRACNKVLCTAATLLNDSIDEVLARTVGAEAVVIVGPTASFLPDPLFRRGVTAVGGTRILDAAAAIKALRKDRGLGKVASRYLITREAYPGADTLLGAVEGYEGISPE